MLRIQGKIKGIRLSVTTAGVNSQVVLDFRDDAVLDELQAVMREKCNLTITLEKQQLSLGDIKRIGESLEAAPLADAEKKAATKMSRGHGHAVAE